MFLRISRLRLTLEQNVSIHLLIKIKFSTLNVSTHFALKGVPSKIFTKHGFSKSGYLLRKNDAKHQNIYINSCCR